MPAAPPFVPAPSVVALSRRRLLQLLPTAPLVGVAGPAAARLTVLLKGEAVNGHAYYDHDAVRNDLRPGARLTLVREPSNPHDPLAVEVIAEGVTAPAGSGRVAAKLGYVPRASNEAVARLMDAGADVRAVYDGERADELNWSRSARLACAPHPTMTVSLHGSV